MRMMTPLSLVILVAVSNPVGGQEEPRYKGKLATYWIHRLDSKQVLQRRQAVEALRELGPAAAAAVPALLERLRDEDVHVRLGALDSLGRIGPPAKAAVPTVLKALNDQDSLYRLYGIEALGGIGPEARAAIPELLRLLKEDKGVEVRSAACRTLGGIGAQTEEVVPALLAALRFTTLPESPIGSVAGEALARIGSPAMVPLLDTLAANDRMVAERASSALGKMGPSVVPVLVKALTDKNPQVRELAARALGSVKPRPPTVIPALALALKDPVEVVRTTAVETLVRIGPDAVASLVPLLQEENPRVREAGAVGLAQLKVKDKAAVKPLVNALKDKESGLVRSQAQVALYHLGAEAAPALFAALKDKENEGAATALAQLGPNARKIVPELIRSLREPDLLLRRRVIFVLGQLGAESVNAVPALTEALSDRDLQIRLVALEALKRIQASQVPPGRP